MAHAAQYRNNAGTAAGHAQRRRRPPHRAIVVARQLAPLAVSEQCATPKAANLVRRRGVALLLDSMRDQLHAGPLGERR